MLELTDVTAGYGTHPVLRGVDLVVPDGAVVALLGPNGAGKTTLLRVASGALHPTRGSVRLDGIDVSRWAPDRLARAGLCHVPAGRGVFPSLSVRANLRLMGGPAAGAGEPVPALAGRLGQRAGTLSGGERQMLALSRLRSTAPRVALLDEVSTGLAPRIIDEIFGQLRQLADGGVGVLLVEQYVGRALDLADYVYVLRKGQVTFVGEPAQLRDEQIREAYLGV